MGPVSSPVSVWTSSLLASTLLCEEAKSGASEGLQRWSAFTQAFAGGSRFGPGRTCLAGSTTCPEPGGNSHMGRSPIAQYRCHSPLFGVGRKCEDRITRSLGQEFTGGINSRNAGFARSASVRCLQVATARESVPRIDGSQSHKLWLSSFSWSNLRGRAGGVKSNRSQIPKRTRWCSRSRRGPSRRNPNGTGSPCLPGS